MRCEIHQAETVLQLQILAYERRGQTSPSLTVRCMVDVQPAYSRSVTVYNIWGTRIQPKLFSRKSIRQLSRIDLPSDQVTCPSFVSPLVELWFKVLNQELYEGKGRVMECMQYVDVKPRLGPGVLNSNYLDIMGEQRVWIPAQNLKHAQRRRVQLIAQFTVYKHAMSELSTDSDRVITVSIGS